MNRNSQAVILIGAAVLIVVLIVGVLLILPTVMPKPQPTVAQLPTLENTATPTAASFSTGTGATPTGTGPTEPSILATPITNYSGSPTATALEYVGGNTTPVVPTVDMSNGVPLARAGDILGGKLTVVSVTFPAADAVKQMELTVPDPGAGKAWAMVELLAMCNPDSTCAADTSEYKLVSSSGTNYPADPSFGVEPVFGKNAAKGTQAYGYLGFIVPSNEQVSKLEITQNGQVYTFSLR